MEFDVVVLLGRMIRYHSNLVIVGPRGSSTLFIQIYVDRCQLLLSVDIHTL